jgi:hypothetical protein
MGDLGFIVRRHGKAYLAAHGHAMLPSHRRALADIAKCRTPESGSVVYQCAHCGHSHHVYCSCRNRNCPQCHGEQTRQWIEKRRGELLPVAYFHVVFTLPSQLHPLCRSNQKLLYPMLMDCAGQSLLKLAADPKYLGGLAGAMAVLHTWTQTLDYHPHVHLLVPAGAVRDGHWLEPRSSSFLVPVKALSKVFRGTFLEQLARALPEFVISRALRRSPWVVYAKPAAAGPVTVLDYLARYVHRVAICNSRILALSNDEVTFHYRNRRTNQTHTMKLGVHEFLRRFLQHVLPQGLHKVRYYGFWAPWRRNLLRQIQAMFFLTCFFHPQLLTSGSQSHAPDKPQRLCPNCGRPALRRVGHMPALLINPRPQPRSPP